MNREEIRPILIFPSGEIVSISPELNSASELVARQASELVNYLQTINSNLTRMEATHLAAALLHGLPEHFKNNPELLTELKAIAQEMINSRPKGS